MFAPKDLRPSEIMALRTLIGGRTGNMPQTLEGIIESRALVFGRARAWRPGDKAVGVNDHPSRWIEQPVAQGRVDVRFAGSVGHAQQA